MLILKTSIISYLSCFTNAHVILEGGSEYDSQPAAFGTLFQYGKQYQSRVQLIPDDPYLCGIDENGNPTDDLPERQEGRIIVPADATPGEKSTFLHNEYKVEAFFFSKTHSTFLIFDIQYSI